MKAIKNFGRPTIAKLLLFILFFLFNTVAVMAQNIAIGPEVEIDSPNSVNVVVT